MGRGLNTHTWSKHCQLQGASHVPGRVSSEGGLEYAEGGPWRPGESTDPRAGTGLVLDLSSAQRGCSGQAYLNPLHMRAGGDGPGRLTEAAVCSLLTE